MGLVILKFGGVVLVESTSVGLISIFYALYGCDSILFDNDVQFICRQVVKDEFIISMTLSIGWVIAKEINRGRYLIPLKTSVVEW